MLVYLDQIGDKKLKAPSTEDASKALDGHLYASSIASMRTAGGLSVEKRISVGQFDGRVPLGGVIPVIGSYSSANNLGTFTTASGIPDILTISEDGFMRCQGQIIPTDQEAKLSGYVPNISDERFIQGSTTAGFATVINLSAVNQGNNFIRLTVGNMPSHNHGGVTGGESSHTHGLTGLSGSFSSASIPGGGQTGVAGSLIFAGINSDNIPRLVEITGTVSLSGGSIGSGSNHNHSISSQGNNDTFDVRPKYINAIYLIRVR
jgi:hypothetical protein